ncbi:MAG: VWA domain-containing protein [Coriobacteriales bacterium]
MSYARLRKLEPREKSSRVFRNSCGMAVLSVLAAMAVAMFGAVPAFAAESASGPETSKTLTENASHTGGTIALSVKGSSSYSTTSTSANVIFVVDTSGSMQGTRLSTAKTAIKAAASTILDQDNTKVSLVEFNTGASTVLQPTDSVSSFDRSVNDLADGGGTNWEAGLSEAQSLVSTDSNTQNYVIFVSDGNPTFRDSANGYTGDYNRRYGVYGTGNSDPYGLNFGAADAVAKSLVADGVTLYNINAFGDATNMQSLGGIASDHYFDASDSTALQNALSTIVRDIVNAHDYRNVTMRDTISDAVVSDTPDGSLVASSATVNVKDENGDKVTLTKNPDGTYSYTKDGVTKTFNGPTVSGKTVTWSLGEAYQLENGWTYTISFDVLFTQDTLDKAAALLNGTLASDPNMAVEDGVVKVYTNTASGNDVSYIEQTTVNNVTTEKSGQEDFARPSITVPTATNLTVSKKVSGSAANTGQEFDFVLSNSELAGKTYGTGESAVTFDSNGEYAFQLKHGESRTVSGLPVGTTLSVRETGLSGNAKTSTTARVDGGDATTVKSEGSTATETDATQVKVVARAYTIKDGKLVAPTDANTVEYTNTAELVPQTGVSVDTLPMVALLGVAVAGGVAVAAGVRKSHGREE